MVLNTLFCGTPAVGKSTLANALIGEIKFKSGVSLGRAMTTVLQKEVDKQGNIWMDTPGLSWGPLCTTQEKQAAQEIEIAFKQSGIYKLIFVLTLQSGRIRSDDLTTMRMILRSVPKIGTNYSVIVNKVAKGVLRRIENQEEKDWLISGLLLGLNRTKSIYFLQRDSDVEDEEDQMISCPNEFFTFIEKCPTVEIVPDDVNEIPFHEFEQLRNKIEAELHTFIRA